MYLASFYLNEVYEDVWHHYITGLLVTLLVPFFLFITAFSQDIYEDLFKDND
jgi:hypothetical protein